MYKRIVVGVDQSYQDTGVSICADGRLVKLSHIDLGGMSNNSEKRKEVSDRLNRLFGRMVTRADKVDVIMERIRLRSDGFVSIDYIKAMGAMNGIIIDAAYNHGLEVSSVDTRSWKSQVVGTSKPGQNSYGIDANKWPTIQYVIGLGYESEIRKPVSLKKKKGVIVSDSGERYTYNDNIADSACIALYGFLPISKQSLVTEH